MIVLYCESISSQENDSKSNNCDIGKVYIATAEKSVIKTGGSQRTKSDEDLTGTTDTMERANISNIVTGTPYPTDETGMAL